MSKIKDTWHRTMLDAYNASQHVTAQASPETGDSGNVYDRPIEVVSDAKHAGARITTLAIDWDEGGPEYLTGITFGHKSYTNKGRPNGPWEIESLTAYFDTSTVDLTPSAKEDA